MLWSVRRWSFLLLATFLLLMNQVKICQAREISVELVWKFGQAGWVEIQAEQGLYQVVSGTMTLNFPKGSRLEVGWGGWNPILRVNESDFQIFRDTKLEIKEKDSGSLVVRTPEGKAAAYRGNLTLDWHKDHWRLVNQLDSEDYLKGVVPIEMSNAWAKRGLEGLKAQAVAARTYLVKHTQNRKAITDSPDIDQAYAGMNVEGEASQAVEATRGKIIVDVDTGQPIEALYSAHNGGYSEDAKNVWGNADNHNLAHPDQFSEGIGGAADHWRFIISAPQLGSAFGLGPVQTINVEKFPSGRVQKVLLTDEFGSSLTISGRKFVQAFYPFGQEIQANAFLGTLFDVHKVAAAEKVSNLKGISSVLEMLNYRNNSGPLLAKIISSSLGVRADPQPYGVFIFEGRGWGHGVGMSQWGAYHMAQMGYTYEEIIHFYYNNVLIKTSEEKNL
ncbi:amidase enhancer precursor [Desulfosporosinus acididurans]|uniref:Amidase enhancer n=1 Tax=Desulfosporosinus acididurans TaxID=476652 RepID=A0A0J1IP71_9FIRM|nr:SpoIID/LytB domain-containing protein [Desulfosporosinus acididurans]KLU66476.1 amidase enhancer precursor [Desulfosporosinus acididurans]